MADKKIDPRGELETRKHRERVAQVVNMFVTRLLERAEKHDLSKLESPEVEILAESTAKLSALTYGSPEYKEQLESVDMKPFLEHHRAKNRHHPEHFPDGIKGMTLLDIIELLCDWKAASERHNDGNILKSIEVNAERFDIPPVLTAILVNTVKFLSLVE